jgi:hypothetical protein
MAKVAFLISAGSVVQVHPGPPVNTRLFPLFRVLAICLKNHFANYLPTFRAINAAAPSRSGATIIISHGEFGFPK